MTKPHPDFPHMTEVYPGADNWTHPLLDLTNGITDAPDLEMLEALGFEVDEAEHAIEDDAPSLAQRIVSYPFNPQLVDGFVRVVAYLHEDGDRDVVVDVRPLTPLARILLARAEGRVSDATLEAAPALLAACDAAQQCITDLVEVYARGAALVVLDEAVKSLRSDALAKIRSAIAAARGEVTR